MVTGVQSATGARQPGHGGRLADASHAYGVLLALILAALIFQLAAPEAGWARLAAVALQGTTLLVALRVSGMSRIVIRAAVALVVVALLATTGAVVGSEELGRGAGRGVALMLAALAPVAIVLGVVRDVRAAGRVTIRAMFGGLCIYLLLGLLFAFAYGVIGAIDDGSFFAGGDDESQSNFLYFSFVTQTTTGYGDLTAAPRLGRSLAITQALTGQIYLVTVVAMIVANLGRGRDSEGR